MEVTIDEATDRLAELIQLAESGERITITRQGRVVAQLTPGPLPVQAQDQKRVRLGEMRRRIRLLPGWDDPVDPDDLLRGDV